MITSALDACIAINATHKKENITTLSVDKDQIVILIKKEQEMDHVVVIEEILKSAILLEGKLRKYRLCIIV